jgi:hypothetical protein
MVARTAADALKRRRDADRNDFDGIFALSL